MVHGFRPYLRLPGRSRKAEGPRGLAPRQRCSNCGGQVAEREERGWSRRCTLPGHVPFDPSFPPGLSDENATCL